MKKKNIYQQKWVLPVLGLVILGGIIAAGVYSQPGSLAGNLRGVSAVKKIVPAPNIIPAAPAPAIPYTPSSSTPSTPSIPPTPKPLPQLYKPIVTAPADGQVITNFPRLQSIDWTDTTPAITHNVEITCDYCASVTKQWSKPAVYSTAGSLYGAAFPGDNQYRVRVQGVTAIGVTPWSDYVYFSFNTAAQLTQPTQAPALFGPNPNTVDKAFTTAQFGNEPNKFEWSGPKSNVNYYVDYKVCFINPSLTEKCIDANVGQPKGTFINQRGLTSAEWQSVQSALFGANPLPILGMSWKVEMMVTSKATNQQVSLVSSAPWTIWISVP